MKARGFVFAPGFSLIEILVVMVIVGLLAAVVAPNLINKIGGAKSKTARIQIEDLSAALDLYYLDLGEYPSSEQGLHALISAAPNTNGWAGPYLKKKKVPVDPWKKAYYYRAPGEHAAFDLWSLGADGELGGKDENADVYSWE